MDRLILEQSSLFLDVGHLEDAPAESLFTTQSSSPRLPPPPPSDAAHGPAVPSRQRSTGTPAQTMRRAARPQQQPPPSLCTSSTCGAPPRDGGWVSGAEAVSHHHHHRPTACQHKWESVVEQPPLFPTPTAAAAVSSSPRPPLPSSFAAEAPPHRFSGAPAAASGGDAAPRQRQVAAPAFYSVVPEPLVPGQRHDGTASGAGRRYPTPPWWWERCGAASGDDDDEDRLATWDGAAGTDGESRRHVAAAGGAHPVGTETRHPSPTAAPLRSRTRSGSDHRSTSPRACVDDAALGAPPFVDPAAYRVHRLRSSASAAAGDVREGRHTSSHAEPARRHTSPSVSAASRAARSPASSSASAASTAGEAAEACTDGDGATAAVAARRPRSAGRSTSTAAASSTGVSARRLRVYVESHAHPSGFAVPRRGAGTAAPPHRHHHRDLATLPETAADRSAIERAVNALPRAAIYGADNHPSARAVMAYRRGIAARTGLDPAQLHRGPLSARYERVPTGWVEGGVHPQHQRQSGGEVGVSHTALRLRVGPGGGRDTSRPSALYDPVSGLARKPNEVPAAYLTLAVADASRAAAPVAALSGLADQRRQRAIARAAQLHSTHHVTGRPLSLEDRRLYWAEHAPLHAATGVSSVRGLHAVLEGVGEAEGSDYGACDSDGASACSVTEWADSVDASTAEEEAEAEVEVTLDHAYAAADGQRCGRVDSASPRWRGARQLPNESESSQPGGRRHRRGLPTAGQRSTGLVDSHVWEDGGHGDAERHESHRRRRGPPLRRSSSRFPAAQRCDGRRTGHVDVHRTDAVMEEEEDVSVFLYPPLLTPLLHEVDARLRPCGLPTMAELWSWGVADQEEVLRFAGFTRAQRQTILWELERMTRVSSTRGARSTDADFFLQPH
ncbi:hypothetical protein NESM_000345700 [Novymonas esmeraldas]|uniref:Uncharacterized protein n=1 Tax=Novymonas esmeraldas TaxID=1808958 RepID=A0AAW0EM01_9TRYP